MRQQAVGWPKTRGHSENLKFFARQDPLLLLPTGCPLCAGRSVLVHEPQGNDCRKRKSLRTPRLQGIYHKTNHEPI